MKKNIFLLNLLLALLFPLAGFADPEYGLILKFLRDIPANLSDDEAIAQLKSKNFSVEAKKEVHVKSALITKRYKLALFMMEDVYIKPVMIEELFDRPFSDGEPNGTIISAQHYSQQDMIHYIQLFLDKGLLITDQSVLIFHGKPDQTEIFDYLYARMPEKYKESYDQKVLNSALNKKEMNAEEIQNLLQHTTAKVSPDQLTHSRLDNLAVIKLLLEHGADINYVEPATPTSTKGNSPLMVSMASGKPEVVAFLLEKGADPCFMQGSRGPLEYAERCEKNAKTDARKQDYKEVVKLLKQAKKKAKCD